MNNAFKFGAAIALALPLMSLSAGAAQARDSYNGYNRDGQYEQSGDRYGNRDYDRSDRQDRQRLWSADRIRDYLSTYYYDVEVGRRDGDRYLVRAETPHGVALRLRVNGYTGYIEQSRHVRGGSGLERPPLYGPGRNGRQGRH